MIENKFYATAINVSVLIYTQDLKSAWLNLLCFKKIGTCFSSFKISRSVCPWLKYMSYYLVVHTRPGREKSKNLKSLKVIKWRWILTCYNIFFKGLRQRSFVQIKNKHLGTFDSKSLSRGDSLNQILNCFKGHVWRIYNK